MASDFWLGLRGSGEKFKKIIQEMEIITPVHRKKGQMKQSRDEENEKNLGREEKSSDQLHH